MTRPPVRIGVIGASWRAQYALRIARALPDQFQVAGVLVASDSSATAVESRWSVPATTDRARFLDAGAFDYVYVCAPREVAPELTLATVGAGIPALIETPPAESLEGLREIYHSLGDDAPVQVAEQYVHQPSIAARLAVAQAGLLGTVHHARASFAHGYHAMNVIRRALGIGFESVRIGATVIPDPQVAVRGRDGWLEEATDVIGERTLALLEWDNAYGIYDFSGDQYASPIRQRSCELTGERGELRTDDASYLLDDGTAVHQRLSRRATGFDGDLDGFHSETISLGERVLWRNRFAPARLNDDELAVTEVLDRMADFTKSGSTFSSLADACHDHYLGLLVEEAARTRQAITSEPQPWSA